LRVRASVGKGATSEAETGGFVALAEAAFVTLLRAPRHHCAEGAGVLSLQTPHLRHKG